MKRQRYFIEIDKLIELEKDNKLIDTIELLENEVERNNDSPEYLNRYLAQGCLLLSQWEFYSVGSSDEYRTLKRKLVEFIYEHRDNTCDRYRFIYSYFASVNPNIFTFDPREENRIEKEARRLLRSIYINNKDNLVYKYFYLGQSIINKRRRNRLYEKLREEVNIIFPPETYVEEYFNSMINRN